MTTCAQQALVLAVLAILLPGCGDSAPTAPSQAEQEKGQAVSKDLVTKYGYPSAKGPVKTPPRARR